MSQNQHTMNQNQHTTSQNLLTMSQSLPTMNQNLPTMSQNLPTMSPNRPTMSQNLLTMSQNRPTTHQRSMTTQNLATTSLLTGPPWKKSLECTQRTIPIQNQHTMSLPLPTTRLSQRITHLSRPMLHPNPNLLRQFLASILMQPTM